MTTSYAVQGKREDRWETVGRFSGVEEFAKAEQLVRSALSGGHFDEVRLLESHFDAAKGKDVWRQKFASGPLAAPTTRVAPPPPPPPPSRSDSPIPPPPPSGTPIPTSREHPLGSIVGTWCRSTKRKWLLVGGAAVIAAIAVLALVNTKTAIPSDYWRYECGQDEFNGRGACAMIYWTPDLTIGIGDPPNYRIVILSAGFSTKEFSFRAPPRQPLRGQECTEWYVNKCEYDDGLLPIYTSAVISELRASNDKVLFRIIDTLDETHTFSLSTTGLRESLAKSGWKKSGLMAEPIR